MKKTAHYRRTQWFTEEVGSLGEVLSRCFNRVGYETAPTFPVAGGMECLVARRTFYQNAHFIQLVTYQSGAAAAIIPSIAHANEIEADTTKPPAGSEFIHAQLFCVVCGNDAVWTSHNTPIRAGGVNTLLAKMVRELLEDEAAAKIQAKWREK